MHIAGTMNIYSPAGTKVVFLYPNAGYQFHQDTAKKWLKIGETYTVARTEVGDHHTDVILAEVHNVKFNSVMFDELSNVRRCECGGVMYRHKDFTHNEIECVKCGKKKPDWQEEIFVPEKVNPTYIKQFLGRKLYLENYSQEPFDVIAQECEAQDGSISTGRFRRLYNEILMLAAFIAEQPETKKPSFELKAYHVVDSGGNHYCVLAENLGNAHTKFRLWEAKQNPEYKIEDLEDVQSIHPIGDLISE